MACSRNNPLAPQVLITLCCQWSSKAAALFLSLGSANGGAAANIPQSEGEHFLSVDDPPTL